MAGAGLPEFGYRNRQLQLGNCLVGQEERRHGKQSKTENTDLIVQRH